ncbi:class I SAM-dependent methyltransferase [Kiloniella laminariae]|uniref:Class I SAM-dependent methyltransferase n=1 Tax=Kiloniella laminariae TaxID=454162 RepID=A0ABT4LGD4_9PROT|nr:class I SAM-dependent methyltransferase [Kiloniella laminariae]MCZ4279391.1 class I SAM-dependent methyltransferase [Kiloniella laminariae]
MSRLHCRSCGTELKHSFLDLGHTPLANSYVKKETVWTADKQYPLHARVCGNCFLVQVEDVVPPEDIFSDYAYFSSYASSWVEHARNYAESAIKRFDLNEKSFVVEVASNDGYLLQHFVKQSIQVLGIEPAANVAAEARKKSVPTTVAFFGRETALKVRADHGPADLMAANNVLAHVPDINDFVAGFEALLSDEGVVSFEFPSLLNLIENVQFDTIYHEHFSYLSLFAIEKCFSRNGLKVFDVEELSTHGGSYRVWACKKNADRGETDNLKKVRQREKAAKLDALVGYQNFEPRAQKLRDDLLAFLRRAKAEGKRVIGYGAAAKGNTLLNYCGIDQELVSHVADLNPHKQNTLLPGSRIPVISPDEISDIKPDYILILPWNLKTEISGSLAYVRNWGCRFVIPVPTTEVLA